MPKRAAVFIRLLRSFFYMWGAILLQNIHSPEDLKKIPEKQLNGLAAEIRSKIIEVVGKNGGHLASNLGTVELTIALHRVFNSPQDAIIFDVSHQCYTHKMLTGRYDSFHSIRTKGGISGFTRISESPHDYFDAGHASSSISSALGLLASWSLLGRNDKVVAVIGDGALTGGMAYEALCHAGQLSKNLIVIVNDNKMSISPNNGAISRYLSRLTTTASYQNFRYKVDRAVDYIPYINHKIGKFIFRLKRGIKGLFLTNNLFVDLGFEYAGPLNGHNIKQLETVLERAKKIPRPVVIHVITKKGRGYSPAENDPATFHGVGPFNTSDGFVEKFDTTSFTEAFSKKINDLAKNDHRIAAITAAMSKGTGLDYFSRHYKERFFDVGIAEEHAVTFAGGLAAGGMIPITAIYSTFIQRSVDQMIEDIALQNRHAVFVFDRAGAVPSDGETHQGIFDIALFRPVPNLTILSVSSAVDLNICLDWACYECKGPVLIRWPKMTCPSEIDAFSSPIQEGRGLFIKADSFAPALSEPSGKKGKVLLFCTGGMYSECLTAARSLILQDIETCIFSSRFIKPFDIEYFIDTAKDFNSIVFVEDGVYTGSLSSYLESCILKDPRTSKCHTKILAFPDTFLPNGNRSQILEAASMSSKDIEKAALTLI